MFGYHTLWRRKKMRCVIASCLGICAIISMLLVVGSPATTAVQETRGTAHGNRDYAINYKGLIVDAKGLTALSMEVNQEKLLRLKGTALEKFIHRNNPRDLRKADNGLPRNQVNKSDYEGNNVDKNDEYDEADDNGEDDDSYYGNGEDNGDLGDGGELPPPRLSQRHQEEGFVMEDNAADYNQEYDQEPDDYVEGNEDFANPPFKPGDFDYNLLNKTQQKPQIHIKIVEDKGIMHEPAPNHREFDHKSNPDSKNRTHVYNDIQYKAMHLLENNVQHKEGLDVRKPAKVHNKLRKMQETQSVNVKNIAETKTPQTQFKKGQSSPCSAASKCHFPDQKMSAPGASKTSDNVVPAMSSANSKEPKHGTHVNPQYTHVHRINNLQSNVPHGENSLGKINSRLQNLRRNHESNTMAHEWISLSSSDRFPGQNVIYGHRIETQIPIQDGGVDANWLLQEQPATQIQMPELPWQPGEVRSPGGIPLVVDKIYWSREVEELIPTGITNEDFQHFLHKLSTTPVKEMHAPQWNRCGRPRNQYVILRDGTPLCARFREEHIKLIHGEVLSFHFSRVLGLDNVPIVVLSEADSGSPQWFGQNLTAAGWNESSVVAMIQWIHGLDSERSRVKMPTAILEAYETGGVFDYRHHGVHNLEANNLTDLLQWSDMILFDYLTGHYDRVASMQDGADHENRPSIMHENIRNLRKVWQTRKMWLIDNESGLLDGYELLYNGGETGRKFVEFHEQMLKTNCVFRRKTVERLLELSAVADPSDAIIRFTAAQDALYRQLPPVREMKLLKKYLPVRLKRVTDWIKKCQSR